MSSHREAPETARTPSPTAPTSTRSSAPTTRDRHADRQLHPARGPGRAARTSTSSATTSCTRSTSTTTATAQPDITYRVPVRDEGRQHEHVPLQHGPDHVARRPATGTGASSTASRRTAGGRSTVLGPGLASPPCNIGPLSTPNYAALADQAVHSLPGGRKVFAGQRAEGFYVDLGAVFDLGDLRPFQNLHAFRTLPARDGVNATTKVNVHTIAIQVPKADLLAVGATDATTRRRSSASGRGEPPQGPAARLPGDPDRPVGPGLAARQPAVQRGARSARPQGRRGTRAPRPETPPTPRASRTRSSRACCPSSTRACSRTWPR